MTPLCPLHGEHPDLSCADCDAAATRWKEAQAERLLREPEGPGDLENLAFHLRRLARRYPEPVGSVAGLAALLAGIGVLEGLRRLLPRGIDPTNDFFFQCVVFVAPFVVLLVFVHARYGR